MFHDGAPEILDGIRHLDKLVQVSWLGNVAAGAFPLTHP